MNASPPSDAVPDLVERLVVAGVDVVAKRVLQTRGGRLAAGVAVAMRKYPADGKGRRPWHLIISEGIGLFVESEKGTDHHGT